MKLVIQTQTHENYAAHNGFTGEYQWKAKGGNTYVFPGLVWAYAAAGTYNEFVEQAIALVSENNDYYEEYVIDWSFEEDDHDVCYYPEDVIPHITKNEDGTWTKTEHDTEGYFRYGFTESRKQWTLDSEGDVIKDSYIGEYFHPDSGWCNEKELDYRKLDKQERKDAIRKRKEEIKQEAENGTIFKAPQLRYLYV